MITMDEVRILDLNAEYLGVSTSQLMDNAGKKVAEHYLVETDVREGIVIVCGGGNNGGDGLTAARYLLESDEVKKLKVICSFDEDGPKTDLAKDAFHKLESMGDVVDFVHLEHGREEAQLEVHLRPAKAVIEAMLAAGLRGTPGEPFSTIIHMITEMMEVDEPPYVVSIDAPPGLGTDIALIPHATITLHDVKFGMKQENSGEMIVADIGIPDKTQSHVGPGDLLRYPRPDDDAHKGEGGKVMVVGGGPYVGAPIMAGLGALRAGVDLLYLAAPRAIAFQPTLTTYSFIPVPFSQKEDWHFLDTHHVDEILDTIKRNKIDAVVVGCGLGEETNTLEAVLRILENTDKDVDVVVDADGMKAIVHDVDRAIAAFTGRKAVITPHAVEAKRVFMATEISPELERFGEDSMEKDAKILAAFAKHLHATVLFKGPTDIITNGKKFKFNDSGVPRMAVGGTGDVLAGVVGGLLAKGMTTLNAAALAAFLNGYYGQKVFERKGYSMMTTDILDEFDITDDLAYRIVAEECYQD